MYDIFGEKYKNKGDHTMNNLQNHIENYLDYCRTQKCLDKKTLKAYRIDLRQFSEQISVTEASDLTSATLETYVAKLHQQYAPKTVKRKIACLKALFHYLEYKEIINQNPFNKLQIRFREPIILPKTIPLHTIEVCKKHLCLVYFFIHHAKCSAHFILGLHSATIKQSTIL